MNYGIWMNSAEQVKGGFESSSGTDFYVTSPNSYSDNQWHYAVVTYGGSTVILYIDGVQVGSKSTSGASPDSSGTQPVRIGANSRVTPPTSNFFIGNVDEVRVWNDDLTATEQSNAFAGTSFNTGEQVLFLDFSSGGGYHYAPSFTATGSNFFDVASSPSLQLSQFSVAAWFKTSTDFAADVMIVNKGGLGSETAGQNMNWGIWMNSAEQVKGGFETSSGTDFYVTSPNSYRNNQWHYAVVTYGGSTVILYIDGVQVGSKSTSGASPDSSGTQPVRIGANSRTTPPTSNFFIGDVDEVRTWNDDLTATEQANAFAGTSFNTGEQVLYLDFTNVQSGLSGGYSYGPSLTLSGPS
jgi:Concanavalin A-like lectin/glucanases superfamily